MINKKSISIILPNYNGAHLMEMYIPSVFEALNFSKIDFEFIVIDDYSTDDSIEFIEKKYPEIILIKNNKNSGFSYSCNQGIQKATKELIFLLNSDVKLTPDYFEAQWRYFDKKDTFGVMGCIMNFDGKKIEDASRLPSFKGAKFKANKMFYPNKTNDTVFTTYLSGANALIDKEKLSILGGFNEIYSPFYFEDFDLGLRAWKLGWYSYYEHQSKCFHKVSASTKKINKSNFVKIIYYRNGLLLQTIHLQGTKKILSLVQFFTISLLWHILKGEFWIFKSITQFIKKRKAIKKSIANTFLIQQKLAKQNSLYDICTIIKSPLANKEITFL